jgi:hypothetical protein
MALIFVIGRQAADILSSGTTNPGKRHDRENSTYINHPGIASRQQIDNGVST